MTTVSCPGCNAQFDLAQLAGMKSFTCAACGQVMNLHVQVQVQIEAAGPPPPRPVPAVPLPVPVPQARAPQPRTTTPPPPPPGRRAATRATSRAAPSSQRDTHRGARRDTRSSRDPAASGGVPVAAWAAAGGIVVVLIACVVLWKSSSKKAEQQAAEQAAATAASAAADTGPGDAANPAAEVDWDSLSGLEREQKVAELAGNVAIRNPGSVEWTLDKLISLGEHEAAERVAERYIKVDPAGKWVWEKCGRQDIREKVEVCLDSCPRADDVQSPALSQLSRMFEDQAPATGAWWASMKVQHEVEDLITAVQAEEQRLANDFEYGVARWSRYQRSTHVMRDFPSVHLARAPHLVFAQIAAKPGTKLADVDPTALRTAQAELETYATLLDSLYEGWHAALGPGLGLTKFTEANTDHSTLQKVNVFPSREAFDQYHQRIGDRQSLFVQTYYAQEEPRFVTTCVGGEGEWMRDTRQVFCQEAVRQLQHLASWDLTRKALGRELHWDQLDVRPLWSEEGFAQFFSSHHKVNANEVRWMEPLDSALLFCSVLPDVVAARRWQPMSLEDQLGFADWSQLRVWVTKRSPKAEWPLAQATYANLLLARSWSFVSFLWNAERNSVPIYRDRFLTYLKHEYVVRLDPRTQEPVPVTAADLKTALQVTTNDGFAQLERAWREWEAEQIQKHEKPSWPLQRKAILLLLGGQLR